MKAKASCGRNRGRASFGQFDGVRRHAGEIQGVAGHYPDRFVDFEPLTVGAGRHFDPTAGNRGVHGVREQEGPPETCRCLRLTAEIRRKQGIGYVKTV